LIKLKEHKVKTSETYSILLIINNNMARKSINLGTFTTNTESKMVSTASFKVIILTLITVNFTGTIKFFVSNSDYVGSPPNLSSVASTTNEYSEVIVVNLGKTELPIS